MMHIGVIRPGYDVEGGENVLEDSHCFYSTYSGRRAHWEGGTDAWEGMDGTVMGDHIGMLLDFDQGSMTIWKNDEKLGVMVAVDRF